MKPAKISIWAIDDFTKFDAFVKNGFGISEVKTLTPTGTVKMVHVDTDLDGLLAALKSHDDNLGGFENLRKSLFKKDGGLRKLGGRSVNYATEGFSVTIEFLEERPVYEMVSGGFEYYIVKKGNPNPVYQSGDVTAVIKELERLNSF